MELRSGIRTWPTLRSTMGTGEGKTDAQIGGQEPEKVGAAVIHNLLDRGIHAHDKPRGAHGKQRKGQGEAEHQPEHDRDRLLQGIQLLHAPVARGEHGSAHAQAHAEDLKQVDELAAQGGSGELGVAHGAEHDGVHQVHTDGNQLLRGNGQRDGQDFPLKGSVSQAVFPVSHSKRPFQDEPCSAGKCGRAGRFPACIFAHHPDCHSIVPDKPPASNIAFPPRACERSAGYAQDREGRPYPESRMEGFSGRKTWWT